MAIRLSLCMIVKDEEHQLAHCLESVRGVADELVVVDTGSTDRTVAIAESFGARVVHHPWDGSFASARNVSLDSATGDWVLILDADERVTRGDLLRLALEAAGENIESFILPLINFVGERAYEEAVTAPSVRVFRNRPEYRYTRALHEQIIFSIQQHRPGAVVGYVDAPIEHFGYLNRLVADKDKVRRNLALAQEEVSRYPEDAFSWYNLAQEHFRLCEWEAALAAYRRAFPYLESLAAGFAPALVKHLCVCLLSLQRPDEVLAVTDDAVEAYEQFTDLWILRGLACLQQGDPREALAMFREAADRGEVPGGFYISDEGVGSYKALGWIGACHLQLRELDQAEEAFLASLAAMRQRNRYLPQPLEGLRQVHEARRRAPAELVRTLRHAVEGDPRWGQLAGRMLLTQGLVDEALEFLGEPDGWEQDTLLSVGALLLRRGDRAGAMTCWDRIPAGSDLAVQADWHRLLAHAIGGDLDRAEQLFCERLANRGEGALVALYRGLVSLWRGAPTAAPRLDDALLPLREHLTGVLRLLLQAGATELLERSLPALGWLALTEGEQAALMGRLYAEQGLQDAAFEALALALEAGERSVETLRPLGLLCLRRGLYAEAEVLLGEVLRAQAEHDSAWSPQNAALVGYLAALSAQGKNHEAEPLWQQLLAGEPPAQPAHQNVA